MSGLFSGVKDAKVGQGGLYYLDGQYKVEIERVFTMKSRKREDLFIVETKILESSNAKRPEGMRPSWVVNLKQDAALGNIKGFVAAANGIDPADVEQVDANVDEEACEFACSKENPLKGVVLNLECVTVKTREGGDFTLHKWSPAE
jgi:hypothetical protein